MTDLTVAASPTASALAEILASGDSPARIAPYRGALSPVELDARTSEIEALARGAAVHDMGWLRRVAVRGEDRFRWLSGMVTNTVKDLPSGAGAWNLVLNAQGRIQGDLTIWRDTADNLELEMAADQYDRLLAHLDHFIIMDDVELAGVNPVEETALGLTGPKAGEILGRMGLPALPEPLTQAQAEFQGAPLLIRRGYGVLAEHYAIWIPASRVGVLWQALGAVGAKPVGSASLDAFRIAEGIPAYGIDMVERDLPQETSQMRALHFSKGCYLGQEIVERIRSRGNVHRHLRSLELDGALPDPGTKLALNGAEAGHITSATELPLASGTRLLALGMIRAEAEQRDLPLTYVAGEKTGTARVVTGAPQL
jgi:folate-binding protein YgfZ